MGRATDDTPRDLELRRFGAAEIAFHWALVVPYVVLGASGVLLLIQKNAGAEWIARSRLVAAHLGAGLALVLLPLLVLAACRPEPFRRNLRECLRWRWSDVWWLHASALRVVLPRLRLPPEGRFNAGQKLNLLHVATIVPAIAATGLALWCIGGSALAVRSLHVSLALLSLAMAAGHVYLAVINPSTRKALGGMFHGRVRGEYAAAHHPLWFAEETGCEPEASRAVHPRSARLVRLSIVCLGLLVVLSGAGGPVGDVFDALRRAGSAYFDEPGKVLQPAPLHPLHAAVTELERCASCHDAAGGVSADACLACHEDVATRLRERRGYHGVLSEDCGACHADHREAIVALDDSSFQHDKTLFRLAGAHRDAACDACHARSDAIGGDAVRVGAGRRSYIGLPRASCASCHESPHDPPLEAECSRCHLETTWREPAPTFDHAQDASFALGGTHAALACAACHGREGSSRPLVLAGTPRDCAACHADVADALAGRLGGDPFVSASPHHEVIDCVACHRDDLTARPCSSCHPNDYDGLFVDWQARVEKRSLSTPRPDPDSARRAARHNWEAVLGLLRADPTPPRAASPR